MAAGGHEYLWREICSSGSAEAVRAGELGKTIARSSAFWLSSVRTQE
jgi:hypothetical protein